MRNILFMAHRLPWPPDRGDRIRGFHILKYLSARARIHLVAFADDRADLDPPPEFRDLLASCTVIPRRTSLALAAIRALASGRPVSLAAFDSPAIRAAVADLLATSPIDAIHVFSGQMGQYVPHTTVPTIMDFGDVDSAKFASYAETGTPAVRWMMRREARLLGAFEHDVARRAKANLFVTEAEAAVFRQAASGVPTLVVENGIDTSFYDPAAEFTTVAEAGQLIVFTGQMDYRPNIDAVTWFVADVLPRICQHHPLARFAIVGRAPTAAVSALRSDRVIVTGAVDDVRGWIAASSVSVAPLRIARGIQNKVLEAMAMARPVVASSGAAEGIDHAGAIRVGAGAEAIADEVSALLAAPATATALGAKARARVIARYGWNARLAALDDLFDIAERRAA